MNDFSLHILDLVQNSLTAGADDIHVTLAENTRRGSVLFIIRDNGRGPGEAQGNLFDPFYSTKATRKFGLGLALIEQAARQCGGWAKFRRLPQGGSVLICRFEAGHWDLPSRGRLDQSFLALLAVNRHCRFRFNWFNGQLWRRMDSRQLDCSNYSVLKTHISAIFGEGNQ